MNTPRLQDALNERANMREYLMVHRKDTPAPDALTQSTHTSDVSKKDAEIDMMRKELADMTAQRDDLLAALQLVINEGLPIGPGYAVVESFARAAIARATGGQP